MLATALLACGGPGTTVAAAGSGGFGPPVSIGAVVSYAVAASILAVGLLALALLVIFTRRDGPTPTPVPVGATISPDGLYWWDGTSWRPVR